MHTYGLPVGIVRSGNLFGGGDLNFERMIPGVIRETYFGRRFIIRGDGQSTRDYLYVEDAVEAYLRLAEALHADKSPAGEAFNISQKQLRVIDLLHCILRIMQRQADQVLRQAVRSAPLIFDLAGSSGAVSSNASPVGSLDRNCRDQLHFLLACKQARHRPHVVFASSRLVYGAPRVSSVAEDHPVAPQSFYAAHKLCVERYLQVYAGLGEVRYSICRISNAYGPDAARPGSGYRI